MSQAWTSEGSAKASGHRSTMQLLRDFGTEAMRLIRQEVALAKAETSEKAAKVARNSTYIVVGGLIAFVAVQALVASAIAGLTVAFNIVWPWYHALWFSALLVGVVAGIVGYIFIQKGISTLKRMEYKPNKTIETIQENKQWLKRAA